MSVCRVIRPPSQEACGKEAGFRLVFRDGDKAPACHDCALYLKEIAGPYSATVTVEPLDDSQNVVGRSS
jgi:hypothetical protein